MAPDSAYCEYLTDRDVVLVGPSAHVLGSGQGADIDDTDIVARVNMAVPVPLEVQSDIGSRTDILYDCLRWPKGLPDYRKEDRFRYCRWLVCPFPAISPFKKDIAAARLLNRDRVMFRTACEQPYLDLEQALGTRPNTGFAAIWDLLRFPLRSLYITGFTFYLTEYMSAYPGPKAEKLLAVSIRTGRHLQQPQMDYFREHMLTDPRLRIDGVLQELLQQTEDSGE